MSKALPSNPRALASAVCSALALVLLALPASAPADSCPNAAERFGASATLPDCRAYELVTPMIKEDNGLLIDMYGFADGNHVAMSTILPLPGAKEGEPEVALSSRTTTGWQTTPITPQQGPGELDNIFDATNGANPEHVSFASDFSAGFVSSTYSSEESDQNLVADVYKVSIPGGSSLLQSLPDTGPITESLYHPAGLIGEPGSYVAGNSADGSHVFFATAADLSTAPGTPANEENRVVNQVYERYAGHTYLVGVMPDGTVPACGAELGNGGETGVQEEDLVRSGAVSADGTNVVFHTDAREDRYIAGCPGEFQGNPELGGLYLRKNNGTPQASTVSLPGDVFLGRTADGSKILSTGEKEGSPSAIFEYDIPTGQSTRIGDGALLAYSTDGSRVYYLAGNELDVYDHGVTKTVPNAGRAYAGRTYRPFFPSATPYLGNLPVTTPDGSKLLFLDRVDLTSYDAHGPNCAAVNLGELAEEVPEGQNCAEAYIYDLETGRFTCVSCNPGGTPPMTNAALFETPNADSFLPIITHSISDDGERAFFQTTEALVPQDTNGLSDVYEWENGHIYMLSSGQGGVPGYQEPRYIRPSSGVIGSEIVGISSSGDDVFIATTDHLLPQDIENSEQIYDARVGGGFPYTTPVYGCDSGQCQGPQTPAPSFAPPPSATFVGLGNAVREDNGSAVKATKAKPKPKSKAKTRHKAKKKTHGKAKKGNRNGKGRK